MKRQFVKVTCTIDNAEEKLNEVYAQWRLVDVVYVQEKDTTLNILLKVSE